MSLKLEDFRKRLLQPTDADTNATTATKVAAEGQSETADLPSEPAVLNFPLPSDKESMGDAVRKAFGQVGTLKTYSQDFTQAGDQLDRLGNSVTRIFGPLRNIYSQMSEVAGSFEALRSFQADLSNLSKDFAPMRLLHEQVKQLTSTVQDELGQLVEALGPVKDLNEKVNALARSLRQVGDLQSDLADLYAALRDGERSQSLPPERSTEGEVAALH